MTILSGKPIAEKILSETKARIAESGIVPGLGIVLVGDDAASRIYVELKEKRARELGIHVVRTELPAMAAEADVQGAVRAFNADPSIHGIIVQLPLPEHIDADRIIAAVDPTKDADGFIAGDPVFPEAIIELAKSVTGTLSGKKGMVIANSERFGETMRRSLEHQGVEAEYVLGDSVALDRIRGADIVVTALGRPDALSWNMFKKGAIVIDGGIARKDGRTRGDVSTEGDGEDVFLSPVPGGVGPVTIACLLRRVADLATRKTAS